MTRTRGVYEPQLGLPLVHAGKVRELYALPDERLLMVATDNISAFDYVLRSQIPDKGRILNSLSLWWFDRLADVVDNHVLSVDVPAAVTGRAVVCERLAMIGFECVARGYLTGSGWAEYQQSGTVCGVSLPAGLVNGSRLAEPIFTPATKAALGEHDENVPFDTMADSVGGDLAGRVRDLTLAVYARAEGITRQHGLILADTKLEFGQRADGTVVLADEVLTPDSSRFWDGELYAPGSSPQSFDKQFVRDFVEASGWNKEPPAPRLPDDVISGTRDRYVAAYERLTGRSW